jgi:hypothetical protein
MELLVGLWPMHEGFQFLWYSCIAISILALISYWWAFDPLFGPWGDSFIIMHWTALHCTVLYYCFLDVPDCFLDVLDGFLDGLKGFLMFLMDSLMFLWISFMFQMVSLMFLVASFEFLMVFFMFLLVP